MQTTSLTPLIANRIAILVLMLIQFSCTHTRIPSYLKKEFKYNPSTKYNITAKFHLSKGFYRDVKLEGIPTSQILCFKSHYKDKRDTSIKENTLVCDLMFFDNGMCLVGCLNSIRWEIDSKNYHQYINEATTLNKPGYFRPIIGSYWGPYEINYDTVKIKVLYRSSLMSSGVSAYEQWYKIIDSVTLRPILFKGLVKGNYNKHCDSVIKIDSRFHPDAKYIHMNYAQINPNYSWIMNKKWFWANKREYKNWRKTNL